MSPISNFCIGYKSSLALNEGEDATPKEICFDPFNVDVHNNNLFTNMYAL